MENLNIESLGSVEWQEQIHGGSSPPGDVWWEFLDFFVDYYPTYVNNGCPGTYNEGCNSIGMGLSGNTPFTGY